jgi:hypothetical protein
MPSYEYSVGRIPSTAGRPPILSLVSETGHERSRFSSVAPSAVYGLLEWPRGIGRLAAASCAVVSLAVLAYEIPRTVDSLGDGAARNAALSYADRDIAGGNSILVDQVAAYEARAFIPPHDTFRVVTGPNLNKTTPLTLQAISAWLTYFLMPRRQSGQAAWVVCYGCDASQLGRNDVRWQDEFGISIRSVVR